MQRRRAMDTAAEAPDLDSTLIRRGVHASTFREMQEFAETIERRPLEKLLAELPGLALLSDMKFHLARQVIRRRIRGLNATERQQLCEFAFEVSAGAKQDVADRIREIFRAE